MSSAISPPNSRLATTRRGKRLCSVISLILLLLLLIAPTAAAQGTGSDAFERISELQTIAPTVEDQLRQDEERWSLKRGVSNTVFFRADGLHIRSHTLDANEPSLVTTQSDLPADALLVEVDARHVNGSLFNGYGLFLTQAPDDHIFFYISNNGYVAIEHTAPDNQEMFVPWQEAPSIKTQSGATNQLALLAEEGQATFLVNGSDVATVDGLVLEGATLGLMATSYEEGMVEIAFRNLRYWDLNNLADPCAPQGKDIEDTLTAAAISLDDLPDDFESLPEDDVQEWLQDSVLDILAEDGSVQVVNHFGFFQPDHLNFVLGASGSILNPIDGLITYMATTAKQDPAYEMVDLDQVGDESGAFAITITEDDESARLEFLVFRRNDLVVMLIIAYPDGTDPLVTLGELAQTWDARLADPPDRETGEIDEADCIEKGKILLEQAKWQQALEAFTQVIETNPENFEAYYYRGLAHYRLGAEDSEHYVMAIEDLTLAIESEDFFVEASAIRNKISQVADTESLLASYTEQIENSERPAAAYAGRGIVYRDQLGDYENAIADLTQAINLATEYQRGDYYVERAFTYAENGNTEAAIEDATQAIEDEYTTDLCSAYAYRGGEYAKLGEYEEAESDLERARENCGDDTANLAFVSHQLGVVRYYEGEVEEALSLFNDSIGYRSEAAYNAAWESWESDFASEPDETFEVVIAYFEMLVAEHQLQTWREGKLEPEYEEYLSVLQAYDEIHAGAARAYGWLGAIYREQSKNDSAIEAYTIAIEADPTDTSLPYWYVQRARIFYDQQDFDAARDDLAVAITLGRPDEPEMATAYNLLGLMASEEGNHQEALEHYNVAISIKPEDAVFYYNRALTFYDLDDSASAIADFEIALALSDDDELRGEVEEWLSLLE